MAVLKESAPIAVFDAPVVTATPEISPTKVLLEPVVTAVPAV